MSEGSAEEAASEQGAAEAGPGGSYEVIRKRLAGHGRELTAATRALNEQRQELFGGTELSVLGTERVRTENNCVPVDVVQVGGLLLFGYNVFVGLRKTTSIDDVFSVQRFAVRDDGLLEFTPASPEEAAFLHGEEFQRSFTSLYHYYSATRLISLRSDGRKLLAVFQTGEAEDSLKVFQWGLGSHGEVEYIDDRGERAFAPPPAHDFEWSETSRDDHILGRHPHVSIEDMVFVETVGGDLTIKVEDNTEDGRGIYREDVDDPNQSLDDARILYAIRGSLVLMRIRPYQEEAWRHLVFNARTQHAMRIDSVGDSCVALPEDHGVIFPGGYVLQTGEYKVFPDVDNDLRFQRKVASPNGEDVLFVFNRRRDGLYVLFPYNLIRREVQTPIRCHGWSLFDDGRLVVFRASSDEPVRVHPMQVWDTPFASAEHAAAVPTDGSLLARIGNKELVRGLSDCLTVGRMVVEQEPSRGVYEALVQSCQRALDSYFWLGESEIGLAQPVAQVRDVAELVIDEFEKVQLLQRQAAVALDEVRGQQRALKDELHPDSWVEAEQFMAALTGLRTQRGHLITTRDVRYIDRAAIDAMEQEVASEFERISRATVEFLLGEDALTPLTKRIEELHGRIESVERLVDMKPLTEEQTELIAGLDLMTEVVSGLEIDDATSRAAILERLGEVFGQLNRVRAVLANRRKEIAGHEARADFGAQWSLLGQSVSSAVALADSPEACDDQLSRLMLQLEELEARFGEFDEFLPQLTSKREEIMQALGARKQVLVDERQKRVGNLVTAAERILAGVARRAKTFKEQDELNAWFASDAMVLKLRDLADKLVGLGDAVKGEELLSRLTASRQDALRGLRDRLELFDGDAGNLIKFGKHRFPVNTRPLELTMVPRDHGMALHLTGTDFYEVIEDPEVAQAKPYWDQALPSEGAAVARAEYLAASLLFAAETGGGVSVSDLEDAALQGEGLLSIVREWAGERYEEGYERGVHDHDATAILRELLHLRGTAGLLRYPARPRSAAMLFWAWCVDGDQRARWHRRARSFGRLRETLGATGGLADLAHELGAAVRARLTEVAPSLALAPDEGAMAGSYLVEELQAEHPRFAVSAEADELHASLVRHLEDHGGRRVLDDDLGTLDGLFEERLELVTAWAQAVYTPQDPSGFPAFRSSGSPKSPGSALPLETATRWLTETDLDHATSAALTGAKVTGLLSQHPRIHEGSLPLKLDEFLGRLSAWRNQTVPAFTAWREARQRILERERRRLRLSEFEPRVMTAFVRNKLINEVYLPIVGDNLAKQMGAAGDSRRTDQMGLLLLVSPPGYGKTTLMEYIASRLGLAFMKVNGPALGHEVTSLDPGEAPNATARQEVEKINLSFEMANNVMLYLDDIQHTHPELLQKFISLCDGTRRIEGVWKGRTRTYDLRGKKFCVVMAGNPYTESGERFTIPDMLANRADTYNLGDILDGREEAFSLSYVENSLTSNPVLQPLATREQSDVYKLVGMTRGEEIPTSELSHDYSSVELNEILAVLGKLRKVQEVVLAVNQQYIASAAQEDAFRTEPPFKLQGSYRNMNKLSEKIVPAMNDQELDALVRDHYIGEAQTLTTGAEANLLKLWEMLDRQTDEQRERWAEICKEFRRAALTGGGDDDPVTRLTGALGGLDRQLEGIRETLVSGATGDLGAGLEDIGDKLAVLSEQVQRGANAVGHTAKGLAKGVELQERMAAASEGAAEAAALQAKAATAQAKAAKPAKTKGADSSDLVMKLDVMLGELTRELAGIRGGIQGTARGLADLNVLEWLAASPDTVRSNEDVAEVQREVLLQAQNALAGNLREIDPDDMTMRSPRSAVLAGSLPVIQDLFLKIGQLLGSVSLSQEEWSSLMDQLRRHVAEAVTDLAQD